MLHEEVAKYRRLTGDNTSDQIPILRLGGYLDGFDKGIEIGIKALQEVRQAVRDVDIPNPTVPEYVEHHQQMQKILALIDKCIKNLPYDQPEIVRCKDCKHRDAKDGFCEGRGWPMQLVPGDGFCEKGAVRNE